jgi:pimeloyl-ACP methyl ester carboxylesterase
VTPIEVRRYGSDGPEVVLLHGGPGAPGGMASLARDLAGKFRVREPLQRRSGSVALSVERHVEDLAAVAPSRAHVVGHSWGAMLGLSFAARHPERVTSLVLIGCGTYDAATRAEYQRALDARLGEAERAQIGELRRRLAEAGDSATRDSLLAELGRVFARADSVDLIAADDADSLPADERGHGETWADVLRLQQQGIEPAAFAAIRAPVLMLHGDDDPHPGPATRDLLRRHVADLSYRGFARCGHDPWRERHARAAFLRALESWLHAPTGKPSR